MNLATRAASALSLCLAAAAASAAAPPACGSLPPDIRDAKRDMSVCITMANPLADCGRLGLDVQIFSNNEGRLPKAGRGQVYWEGKIRAATGAAGQRRLVYLVTDGTKKVIEAKYYSPDHYATFCSTP
ncbi:ribonuclease domain-containing protein [Lysobacter enzymogenes]|uniref:ribonuclease domain-containing protein n=1 Tax=Lysobacter enzymogenes TaxID=69 RepID=UPI00384F3763